MNHEKQILEYMRRHNGITHLEAVREIGCINLKGRISDLRRQGYDITTNREKGINRNGHVCQYARYTLNEQ